MRSWRRWRRRVDGVGGGGEEEGEVRGGAGAGTKEGAEPGGGTGGGG